MTTISKKTKDGLTKTTKQKTYTYEQVLEKAVAYFNGDELADVGAVRNRIQQFVTASTPVAAPAEVTDEEVTDETTAE